MSKFNQQAMSNAIQEYDELYGTNVLTPKPSHTVRERKNLAGGQSFSLSPEMDLYSRVCTMGLSNKFYKSESDQMIELVELIKRNTPSFVAKLAVYAREKMYLRSIPLVLAVELAKIHSGDQLVSRTVSRVIKRADEITEILSYYQIANDRGDTKKLNKLSNQIKKGIREVFQDGRFDAYQYGKYSSGKDVKLRDALFLTHPKPENTSQKDLFDAIVNNTLETPYTWETQMTNAGQTGKSKCDVWEEMIESNRLGYMALIRNIRNFLKEGVSSKHMNIVCNTIADQDKVLKSKQLPFRFLSAYRALVAPVGGWGSYGEVPNFVTDSLYVTRLIEALETAISYSVANLPFFGSEKVLCATDVSGSMIQPVSPRSQVMMFDIGALLCMIAKKASINSVVGMFGDTFKTLSVGNEILRNVQEIYKREGEVGYSTNGYRVLDWALNHKEGFDRIMIFTDCQLYNSGSGYSYTNDTQINNLWTQYRIKYPTAKLYMFDLQGYGAGAPIQMMDNGAHLISGWSDKVFDILHRIEQGQSAIDEIESIQL